MSGVDSGDDEIRTRLKGMKLDSVRSEGENRLYQRDKPCFLLYKKKPEKIERSGEMPL
jgi:hypothetical protein